MLNNVSFDWFSFTLKNLTLDDVISDLGLDSSDFESRGFGRFGYRSMICHIAYDIYIMFDGTEDMGIHVVVSGGSIKYFMECFLSVHGKKTAFDTYATHIYDDQFKHFCAYVLQYGSFSRVDVNIDTDMEYMNPYVFRDRVSSGQLVSYYRSWKMIENSDGSGTFYLGKRNSSSFIRVYDKAKEQGDFENTLYRFEVQFNKMANNFMMNFMESGLSNAFGSFIEKQMRFVDMCDNNYSASNSHEWDDFVSLIYKSGVCAFENYMDKKRKNILNSLFFMFSQYENIIDSFFADYGDINDFVEFMVHVGNSDSPDELMNYLESKGWSM